MNTRLELESITRTFQDMRPTRYREFYRSQRKIEKNRMINGKTDSQVETTLGVDLGDVVDICRIYAHVSTKLCEPVGDNWGTTDFFKMNFVSYTGRTSEYQPFDRRNDVRRPAWIRAGAIGESPCTTRAGSRPDPIGAYTCYNDNDEGDGGEGGGLNICACFNDSHGSSALRA